MQGGESKMLRQRKKGYILLTIVITSLLNFLFVAYILRPSKLDVKAIDVPAIKDGTYIGICQNKILFAVVQVEINNHKIMNIHVLAHKDSYMKQAEQIVEKVCAQQSLDVDAISGATLTSHTVLKAIEQALEKGQHE